ncbi:unnamed protein product, partial [Mesorhabditis spiculigera]
MISRCCHCPINPVKAHRPTGDRQRTAKHASTHHPIDGSVVSPLRIPREAIISTRRFLDLPHFISALLRVFLFCTLVGIAVAAGGMAELKSITGDAPNAPAMMPQPMGFWGSTAVGLAPMDFGDEGPMVGGGVEGMERENLMLGALTVLGNLINPSADAGGGCGGPGVSLAEATGGGFYKGRGNS